jgi:hypothetical protein
LNTNTETITPRKKVQQTLLRILDEAEDLLRQAHCFGSIERAQANLMAIAVTDLVDDAVAIRDAATKAVIA